MSAVESAKSSAALAVGTIEHDALVKEYRSASGRAAAVFERRCNEAILAKSDQLETDKNLTDFRGSGTRLDVECMVQGLEHDDGGNEEPTAGLEDMTIESDPGAPTSHFALTPVLPDGKVISPDVDWWDDVDLSSLGAAIGDAGFNGEASADVEDESAAASTLPFELDRALVGANGIRCKGSECTICVLETMTVTHDSAFSFLSCQSGEKIADFEIYRPCIISVLYIAAKVLLTCFVVSSCTLLSGEGDGSVHPKQALVFLFSQRLGECQCCSDFFPHSFHAEVNADDWFGHSFAPDIACRKSDAFTNTVGKKQRTKGIHNHKRGHSRSSSPTLQWTPSCWQMVWLLRLPLASTLQQHRRCHLQSC